MGLWAKTVSVANPSVEPPLLPFDDHDDPRLIETCCIRVAKQPWDLDQPLQKHARGKDSCGGEQTTGCLGHSLSLAVCASVRQQGEVVQCDDGIFHLAEFVLLVRDKPINVPLGTDTRQDVLVNDRLTMHGYL
jgi:hypothetical protein